MSNNFKEASDLYSALVRDGISPEKIEDAVTTIRTVLGETGFNWGDFHPFKTDAEAFNLAAQVCRRHGITAQMEPIRRSQADNDTAINLRCAAG